MTQQERMEALAKSLAKTAEASPYFETGDRVLISACCTQEGTGRSGALALAGYEEQTVDLLLSDVNNIGFSVARITVASRPPQNPSQN